jgi:hypothetical protein
MYSMDVDWPGDTAPIRASDLHSFDFTAKVKILFCGTCGTPMFFESRYDGPDGPVTTGVFSGTLSNDAHRNLVRITDHIFVGDTVDGGASMWLRHPNADGTPARRFKAGKGAVSGTSEELPDDWPALSTPSPSTSSSETPVETPIRCKCRGVNFVLRPDFSSVTDPKDLPSFVDPDTKKLLAGFDACDSCRLATGTDILNWTFSLLRHVHFAGAATPSSTLPPTAAELKAAVSKPTSDRDPRFGTLTLYESSPGVQRYFCGRCSATVFFACDRRPERVDVAVGLLDSPSGARAEDVLTWSFGAKTEWREDAAGGWRAGLIQRAEEGAEEFRVKRGLPPNFARRRTEEGKGEE